jgi:hypothetical protein
MPRQKRREQKQANDAMFKAAGLIKGPKLSKEEILKMPLSHLFTGIFAGGLMLYDKDSEPYLNPHIGKGGNQCRKDDRKDQALALKAKYPEIWGVRGQA